MDQSQPPARRIIPCRAFSRENPSPHYHRLLGFYEQMHAQGYLKEVPEGETSAAKRARKKLWKRAARAIGSLLGGSGAGSEPIREKKDVAFPGKKMTKYAANVRALALEHGARTCLDYGAGKGTHYHHPFLDSETDKHYSGLQEYWGFEKIDTYEPGLGDGIAEEAYDCVITADVLEHCFRADVPWIVDELFAKARKFVFAHIACTPSFGRLPNGEDMHTTVRPPEWWHGVFEATANRYPGVDFELAMTRRDRPGGKKEKIDLRRERYEAEVGDDTRFVR